MIYTCEEKSMTYLEALVHCGECFPPQNRVIVTYEVPDDIFANFITIDVSKLPSNWKEMPNPQYPRSTQLIGARWAMEKKSVGLIVPSVVLQDYRNCILNPDHPDINKIGIKSIRSAEFDARLLKRVAN